MGWSHTVLGLGSSQLSEGSRESRGLSIRYSQREERPAGKTAAGNCAQGTPLGLREGLEPTRPFFFFVLFPPATRHFSGKSEVVCERGRGAAEGSLSRKTLRAWLYILLFRNGNRLMSASVIGVKLGSREVFSSKAA